MTAQNMVTTELFFTSVFLSCYKKKAVVLPVAIVYPIILALKMLKHKDY